jgi:EmrB/QacA subfamily drug resistance transporter
VTSAANAHCDAAAARIKAPGSTPAQPRFVLLATILGSSLAFVDGSVVNVGLVAIGRNLQADANALQWVINAYLLPLSTLLLLGGAAGDRYGRRRAFITGIIVFGAASMACACAPGMTILLLSRLTQGIGAAMLLPNSLAILGQTFAGQAKGRAIGVWAASGAIAGAAGPVLGGWLIDLDSWRDIFLINLPLSAAAIFLAFRHVPQDPDGAGEGLDVLGAAFATLGLGALTWALTIGSGRRGWTMIASVAGLAALVMFAGFIFSERRAGVGAMLPLVLFASRTFVGLTLVTLFLYGALAGLLVLFPYIMIKAGSYSAAEAGAALLPLPLVLSIMSPVWGSMAARAGSRVPLAFGSLMVGGGFLLALRTGTATSYWTGVFPAVLVVALGMSFVVAPLTEAVLSSVDARHTGSASGFNSAVARAGGLIAVALLGSVLSLEGTRLVAAFHVVTIAGAGVCIAASICAFLLVDRTDASRTLRR